MTELTKDQTIEELKSLSSRDAANLLDKRLQKILADKNAMLMLEYIEILYDSSFKEVNDLKMNFNLAHLMDWLPILFFVFTLEPSNCVSFKHFQELF
jgi:hypothetical protein